VAIVVGDVSGKGVSAAFYASKLTTHLRYQAAGQNEAGEILARTNRILASRDREGMFATLAVAVVDPATGRIELANAGHPSPFVRRRDGRVVPVGRTGGAPLGLNPEGVCPSMPCDLLPGEALVLYTDGVVEALDATEALFDEERTIEAIRSSDGSVDGILASLRESITRFVGDAPQSDDITILSVRRE
jgi:sigma-B regulation protein RsbU (phosphoserine phosphatase)